MTFQACIEPYLEPMGIVAIYSFGSRSLEAYRHVVEGIPLGESSSDFDIGVQCRFGCRPTLGEKVQMNMDIENHFQTKVDIVFCQDAKYNLVFDIIRGEILFCSDKDAQAEYELYVFRKIGDLEPFERERRKLLLGAMMLPSKLSERVIAGKVAWVKEMISSLESLGIDRLEEFQKESHYAGAAESYLRRGLEAFLDLGRYILTKGFGKVVVEYKAIPVELLNAGVIDRDCAALMEKMAGYRNRMVHFYNEITKEELFDICKNQRNDILGVLGAMTAWIRNNPDRIDTSL